MAIGDAVVVAPTPITAGSTATIMPGAGIEWIIHNIYIPTSVTSVELYATDGGANPILIDITYGGGWLNHFFHLTNAQYLALKNTGASTIYMKYDGIVSKA